MLVIVIALMIFYLTFFFCCRIVFSPFSGCVIWCLRSFARAVFRKVIYVFCLWLFSNSFIQNFAFRSHEIKKNYKTLTKTYLQITSNVSLALFPIWRQFMKRRQDEKNKIIQQFLNIVSRCINSSNDHFQIPCDFYQISIKMQTSL